MNWNTKSRRYLKLLSVLAVLFFSHALFAECDCQKEGFFPCENTYVKIDQIDFIENTIYVTVHGKILKTSAIHSDTQGFYFKDFKQGSCDDGYWECSNCRHCNPNYKLWCEICWQ